MKIKLSLPWGKNGEKAANRFFLLAVFLLFLLDTALLFDRIGLIRTYPREIYTAFLLAQGHLLYSLPHYAYFHGPIGPYYYALFFKVWGYHVAYLYVASHLLYLAGCLALFFLTRKLSGSSWLALLVAILYWTIDLPVFTFSQSISSLVGIIANLWLILFLIKGIETNRSSYIWGAGLLLACVLLGKYQLGCLLLATSAFALWLYAPKDRRVSWLALHTGIAVGLSLLVYGYFIYRVGWKAIDENLLHNLLVWHAHLHTPFQECLREIFNVQRKIGRIHGLGSAVKILGASYKDYVQIAALFVIGYGAVRFFTTPSYRVTQKGWVIFLLGAIPNVPQYLLQLTVEHFFTFANFIILVAVYQGIRRFLRPRWVVAVGTCLMSLALGGFFYSHLKTRQSRQTQVMTDFGSIYVKPSEARLLDSLQHALQTYAHPGEVVIVPTYAYFFTRSYEVALNDIYFEKYAARPHTFWPLVQSALTRSNMVIFEFPAPAPIQSVLNHRFVRQETLHLAGWPRYDVYTKDH